MALPSKIGKYEILEIAGRGNMGIVYLAHDPFEDRRVAVEVCNLEDEASESTASRIARKLFFNEAHTAGALDHPNILRVFDAGEEEEGPYIVMEYVEEARTLSSFCSAENLMPISQVAEVLFQSARALDYAHRRGVVHRDIKPTNLMLTANGDVKIGDFGIAQGAQAETTQIMGVLGSPRYMSPEQAREDDLSNQTDLYSLGVVGYELLVGQPPFIGQGFLRLMYKILHEEAAPVREVRPELPASLETIIQCAIHKNLDQRYKMGRELASDLALAFGALEEAAVDLSQDDKFSIVRQLRFFNDLSDSEV